MLNSSLNQETRCGIEKKQSGGVEEEDARRNQHTLEVHGKDPRRLGEHGKRDRTLPKETVNGCSGGVHTYLACT